MRAISLQYHDVVLPGHFRASGFQGNNAYIYKFELPQFERHLKAIQSAVANRPVTVPELGNLSTVPLLFTFDDGGVSAWEHTAGALEAFGWQGHFFVTTNLIGTNGFLTPAKIRDLDRRGHCIGTHSCSHPARMSYCTRHQLRQEWKNSAAVLSDILGRQVDIASVPGGYYGRNVAEEAAEAGISTLFTSEPRSKSEVVDGCVVMGRYAIQNAVSPETAAAIAAGNLLPRCQQFVFWNAKKVAKAAGGTSWLRMRKWLLARS